MRRFVVRLACLAVVGVALAGCDKCGHQLKLNSPFGSNACGDNADPSRG